MSPKPGLLLLVALVLLRSVATDDDDDDDEERHQTIGKRQIAPYNYIPEKRSTMLLDRLMNALSRTQQLHEAPRHSAVDLHRRGDEGKMYWKCYFNAVTCF